MGYNIYFVNRSQLKRESTIKKVHNPRYFLYDQIYASCIDVEFDYVAFLRVMLTLVMKCPDRFLLAKVFY